MTENFFFQSYLFSMGWSLHIFYDLFTHKYKSPELNPRPLYPFSNWAFNYGFINGWKTGMKGNIISWILHSFIVWLTLQAAN